MHFFPTELEARGKSLAQSVKWLRGRQEIEASWFGRGCGVVMISARKLQIQSLVVSTPKISREADWEHNVMYLCHLLLPPRIACQWQLSGTKYSS